MARTQRRQPQAPDPAPAAEPAKPGNGHAEEVIQDPTQAQVELKVKGSGEAARRAIEDISAGGARVADEVTEPEVIVEEEDPIALLLSNPKNMVIVTRQFPRIWQSVPCAFRVEKYPCPITIEQIERDVFSRFGGKSYRVSIHPNTPNGEMRILEAFPIEHPTEDDPVFEDEGMPEMEPDRRRAAYDPRTSIVMDGRDPTLVPDDSPNAVMRRALLDQIKIVTDKKQLAELKRQLKDLEDEDREEREEREARKRAKSKPEPTASDPRDEVIKQLQARLDAMEKQKEGDRFTRLEEMIAEIKAGGGGKKDDSLIATILTNQNSLIQTLITGGGKKEDNFEAMLSKVKLLKDVFGTGDSRVKGLEERLMDIAIDTIEGGGRGAPAEDEDPIKFAVKQGVPVIKSYLEKRIEKDDASKLTKEQVEAIYADAAKKAAIEVAQKLEKEGKLVRVGAAPPPSKPAGNLPAPAPAAPAKNPEGVSTVVTVEPHKSGTPAPAPTPKKEEPPVKLPPGPTSPEYNRKQAVDFVLNTISEDITRGCPSDSFACGDALDRLDDEILTQISSIETAEQLDQVLAPHADPEKLAYIKEMGKNEAVKSWLKRLVVTIQDEYKKTSSDKKKG